MKLRILGLPARLFPVVPGAGVELWSKGGIVILWEEDSMEEGEGRAEMEALIMGWIA